MRAGDLEMLLECLPKERLGGPVGTRSAISSLPVHTYSDADDLIARLSTHIVAPAEMRRSELLSFVE